MSNEDQRFDGLFMSAIQQCQGIENFYEYLFSFMRRKTDFFSAEERSTQIVNQYLKKHADLFKEDKHRQELIKRKKEEAAQASKPKDHPKPAAEQSGATVEEITDEEAKQIEFQELRRKQQEAKNAPKPEGEDAEK